LSWSSLLSKSTRERSQSGVDTGTGDNLGAYVGVTNSGSPPMYVSDSTDRVSAENSSLGFNSNQSWLGTDRSSVSGRKLFIYIYVLETNIYQFHFNLLIL
jgi:hypothetical protein